MSGFIKIKDLGSVSTSGKKVLKASEYSYYVQSQTLLNETKQEASRSQAEASELYLKSIEKGLSQGADEAKARLANQILSSASSIATQLQSLEGQLAEVVITAVRKVLNNFDDETLVMEAVRNGLNLVSKSQRVMIRANPSVISPLRDSLENINHDIDFLEIIPDNKLSKRECVLESDIGIVNASIDEQVAAIEKAIRKRFESYSGGNVEGNNSQVNGVQQPPANAQGMPNQQGVGQGGYPGSENMSGGMQNNGYQGDMYSNPAQANNSYPPQGAPQNVGAGDKQGFNGQGYPGQGAAPQNNGFAENPQDQFAQAPPAPPQRQF